MLRPLGDFLERKGSPLHAADIRYFVEQWLRRELKEEAVLCEAVRAGQVVVRVPTGAWAQAVYVREAALGVELERQGYAMTSLRVTQR